MDNKIVIGIDQSYTRIGVTALKNKEILFVHSIDFKRKSDNTEKRNEIRTFLESVFNDIFEDNIDSEVIVITERIRLTSQGFLNENYIKATGALIATIIDICKEYCVPVYSVDTRSWKSQIVGNSKPLDNPYGINPEKYRTILYLKDRGLLKHIVEPYKGRGKKGVLNVKIGGVKTLCKINDDVADSYCIALYGFLPKEKQKLKEERF